MILKTLTCSWDKFEVALASLLQFLLQAHGALPSAALNACTLVFVLMLSVFDPPLLQNCDSVLAPVTTSGVHSNDTDDDSPADILASGASTSVADFLVAAAAEKEAHPAFVDSRLLTESNSDENSADLSEPGVGLKLGFKSAARRGISLVRGMIFEPGMASSPCPCHTTFCMSSCR